MAHLVPSIELVRCIRDEIGKGLSVVAACERAFEHNQSEIGQQLKIWWLCYKRGHPYKSNRLTDFQKTLFLILGKGVGGAPVYDHLIQLEDEMEQEFERQWKAYLESMPFQLLIPLLLCFFPAYIILLFGPLILQFLQEVS